MQKSQEVLSAEWKTVEQLCPNLGDEVDWYSPLWKSYIYAKVTYSPHSKAEGKYYWWNFINPRNNEEIWTIMKSSDIWRKQKKDENGRVGKI